MKKIILLSLSFLLLLTACGNRQGYVLDAEGGVVALRSEKTLTIEKGMSLKNKDAVSVDNAGNVWFRADENCMVLLGGAGEMRVISLKKNIALELESGIMLVRINKPRKNNESVDILNGSITVSTLDAAVFSIQIETPGNAVLNVFQGEVFVYGQNEKPLITLTKGLSVRFDTETGMLTGQAESIEYSLLPKIIYENVQDYANEAVGSESSESYLEPSVSEPPPEPEVPIPDDSDELPVDIESKPSGDAEMPPTEDVLHATSSAISTPPVPSTSTSVPPSTAPSTPPKSSSETVTPNTPSASPSAAPSEPNTTPPSKSTSTPTSVPPENKPEDKTVAVPPDAPFVSFTYKWDGMEFKPYVDIRWLTDRTVHISWQLYDNHGNALDAKGRFNGNINGIDLKNRVIGVSSPNRNGLYPMGYTIRLTPYYNPSEGEESLPMTPIVMVLPYFKVTTERDGTGLIPVISTNIGLYFEHSYDSLKESIEGNRYRISGTLMPLEGANVPININVLSDA